MTTIKTLRNALGPKGEFNVDARTIEARYAHPLLGQWMSTTQAWSWEGGDALVVLTGELGRTQAYVVVRRGDSVQTLAADGLNAALRALGEDPTAFKIFVPELS